MSKNQVILSSLAMDLKRVALAYHNGSLETAKRFAQEALKRKSEVESANLKPYIAEALENLEKMLAQTEKSKIAEDALMYSTIFQNYVTSEL